MQMKVLLVLALAVAVAPAAVADVVVTFSSPVTMVSFYSAQFYPLTATDNNGLSVTLPNSTPGGAVTTFSDNNVTSVDFSGTANFYVLDDLTYMVGGQTYTLGFDEAYFSGNYVSVGSFYSGLPGSPTFTPNTWILHYPDYAYTYYPPNSFPNVIFEGYYLPPPPPPPPTVPEPGTLVLFGSGLISAAGAIRRKLKA